MNKFFSFAVLSLCITGILFVNCSSNKNSDEACRFQTTMDLDQGNYDAVLASPCVNTMQIGAAWFGKAHFDIKSVINRFSETGSSSTTSDLNDFMTKLVGKVEVGSFTSLDNAKDAYSSITSSSAGYKDALFYVSLVDAVKSLSLIKLAIQDPAGLLGTTCDLNSNNRSDEIDATTCALKYGYFGNTTVCTFVSTTGITTGVTTTATYITTPTFTIYKLVNGETSSIPYPNTFTAMLITTGTATSATCGQYTKLLYSDPSSTTGLSLATVMENTYRCAGSIDSSDSDLKWPCPIDNDQYINFVEAIDLSLGASIKSLNDALTSSPTGTTSDVQKSINEIKSKHCCVNEGGETFFDPANPSSCTCSPAEMADYLQTI